MKWLQNWLWQRELLKQRAQWDTYCSNWHATYDTQYHIAWVEVMEILRGDVRSTREWTA